MTEIRDLSFSYGSRKILDHFSLSLDSSECVVLAGANGRGKSTALSLIAGVLRPACGEVRLDGKVAYVPQGSALFEDMTVAENLSFFASLAKVQVPDDLPFHLKNHIKVKAGRLSGGMKKQLSIACALFGDPKIVLFDEPCAGLDIVYRSELIELIHSLKAKGCEIIYVGHEPMEFASFYDRVVFLGEQQQSYSREQLSGNPESDSRFCEEFARLFHASAQ